MAYVTYELNEPQAIAVLACLKKLTAGQVDSLSPEAKTNLSLAYHRLNGAVARSLQSSLNVNLFPR